MIATVAAGKATSVPCTVSPFSGGVATSSITVLPTGMTTTAPAAGTAPPHVAGSDQRCPAEGAASITSLLSPIAVPVVDEADPPGVSPEPPPQAAIRHGMSTETAVLNKVFMSNGLL